MEFDLVNKIMQKSQELDVAVKQIRQSAYDYAKARHDYRIRIATETMRLKDNGYKVTCISDLVRGNPEVAKLGMQEIITEGVYKANMESIQAIKLQIRLLDAQLTREWGIAGRGDI